MYLASGSTYKHKIPSIGVVISSVKSFKNYLVQNSHVPLSPKMQMSNNEEIVTKAVETCVNQNGGIKVCFHFQIESLERA